MPLIAGMGTPGTLGYGLMLGNEMDGANMTCTTPIRRCAAVALIGLLATVPTTAQERQQRNPPEIEVQQLAALNKQGIHAAARVNGKFIAAVGFDRDKQKDPLTFSDLRDASDLVFVGRVLSNRSVLSANQKAIETHYEVRIDTLIKGPTKLGQVTVVTPGGRLQFSDGTMAQMNTPGFARPMTNHEGLWFLTGAEDSPRPFSLTSGPLGVYLIIKDRVAPTGGFVGTFAAVGHRALARKPQVVDDLATLRP